MEAQNNHFSSFRKVVSPQINEANRMGPYIIDIVCVQKCIIIPQVTKRLRIAQNNTNINDLQRKSIIIIGIDRFKIKYVGFVN